MTRIYIFLDGKNGMGQAQSMSIGSDCSDCYDTQYGHRDRGEKKKIRLKNNVSI